MLSFVMDNDVFIFNMKSRDHQTINQAIESYYSQNGIYQAHSIHRMTIKCSRSLLIVTICITSKQKEGGRSEHVKEGESGEGERIRNKYDTHKTCQVLQKEGKRK